MTRLALVAADWALADARVDTDEFDEFDMGVITASSSGGFEFGQNELRQLWSKGGKFVSAYQSFAWFYAVNTGQISIRNGMRGPSGVVVSDQAGGLDAVAQARRQIRKGSKLIVSGGIDGGICPWGWAAQLASGRMSQCADPDRAYLPFDAAASGYVPGEGGALLILEDAAGGQGARSTGLRQHRRLCRDLRPEAGQSSRYLRLRAGQGTRARAAPGDRAGAGRCQRAGLRHRHGLR